MIKMILKFFNSFFNSGVQVNRVQVAIEQLEIEMSYQRDCKRMKSVVLDITDKLIACARQDLDEGELNNSWKHIQDATRLLLDGYKPEKLKQEAIALRKESEKMKVWRKEAMQALLADGKATDTDEGLEAVRKAMEIRDQSFCNQYYKNAVRGESLRKVFGIIVVILMGVLILAYYQMLIVLKDEMHVSGLLSVMLMGALGASFSVAMSLTHQDTSASIPEQRLGSFITWMRPMVGAAAALAVYIFMAAEIMGFTVKGNFSVTVLAFAFIAGFSERFVVNKMSGPINK